MSIQRFETSIPEKITDLENMHTIDRVARISFGIGLFATLHPALTIVDAPYEPFLPVLAIYPLLTGLLAWDPIYALLRVRTNTVSVSRRSRGAPCAQHDPVHTHLVWALVIATIVLIANAVIVVALGGAG
jgi:hypothetical protein